MASFSLSRGVEPRRRRGPKDGEVEAAQGSWPAGDGGDEVGAAARAGVASGRLRRGRGAGTADDRGGAGARGRGRGHVSSGRRPGRQMNGTARAREDEETARHARSGRLPRLETAGTAGDDPGGADA